MTESNYDALLNDEVIQNLVVAIGEVAEITQIPTRKIRYWEEKGLIESLPTEAGTTRKYDYLNIKKILLIKELVDEGYTLDVAGKKVEDRIQLISHAFEKFKHSTE